VEGVRDGETHQLLGMGAYGIDYLRLEITYCGAMIVVLGGMNLPATHTPLFPVLRAPPVNRPGHNRSVSVRQASR